MRSSQNENTLLKKGSISQIFYQFDCWPQVHQIIAIQNSVFKGSQVSRILEKIFKLLLSMNLKAILEYWPSLSQVQQFGLVQQFSFVSITKGEKIIDPNDNKSDLLILVEGEVAVKKNQKIIKLQNKIGLWFNLPNFNKSYLKEEIICESDVLLIRIDQESMGLTLKGLAKEENLKQIRSLKYISPFQQLQQSEVIKIYSFMTKIKLINNQIIQKDSQFEKDKVFFVIDGEIEIRKKSLIQKGRSSSMDKLNKIQKQIRIVKIGINQFFMLNTCLYYALCVSPQVKILQIPLNLLKILLPSKENIQKICQQSIKIHKKFEKKNQQALQSSVHAVVKKSKNKHKQRKSQNINYKPKGWGLVEYLTKKDQKKKQLQKKRVSFDSIQNRYSLKTLISPQIDNLIRKIEGKTQPCEQQTNEKDFFKPKTRIAFKPLKTYMKSAIPSEMSKQKILVNKVKLKLKEYYKNQSVSKSFFCF